MPRYAVVDNISSVVCTVVEAPDPASACRQFDLSLGNRGRTYEAHDPRSRSAHATAHAYAVYETGADFVGTHVEHGVTAEQVAGLVKVAVVVVRDC